MIKISEEEASFKGQLVRELIARVTSDHLIGQKFKNGEMRKKIVEPPWRCPSEFEMEEIHLPYFSMEYLTKKEGRRADRVLLQLHGGGYVGKIHNTYRSFAVLYAEAGKGMDVLSIDYRVAPENPFPAALMDALTAYDWLREVKGFAEDQIYLGGDSAGGGLCMALCHYLKDHGRKLPRGIVAMSPWTDMTASGASYDDNYEKDPLFGKTRDSLIYNTDYRQDHDPKNPYLSPLFGDFTGFPPMLIQVGTYEMLLSDSQQAAAKAKGQGVHVRLSEYEGMFHVFQMAMMHLPESKRAWQEVEHFFTVVDGM